MRDRLGGRPLHRDERRLVGLVDDGVRVVTDPENLVGTRDLDVDPITRTRLQDEMLSIQRQLSKTIICVTHDIDEALKLGDRILILSEGGRIEQYDTPENILAAPANEFVEDFVGAGSSLKQLSLSRVDELELQSPVLATVGDDGKAAAEAAAAKLADTEPFEVLVLGGGPAGSTAAISAGAALAAR